MKKFICLFGLLGAVSLYADINVVQPGGGRDPTALQPAWAETGTVFRATEVIGAQSNLIETAWQNPASATNWTWTSNGHEITLTGYSGPNAVVIPDMLDGLPVTGFGEVFSDNMDITSVGGGANVKAVGATAFCDCGALISVSLPACTTVGDSAFEGCEALNSVSLPACTTVGDHAFEACMDLNSVSLPACTTVGATAFLGCTALISVSLPACTTVDQYAFYGCVALNSVTFGQNAPAPAADVFESSTPTIYVSNPHATGWGATWNDRPVVRMPLYADSVTIGGTNIMETIGAAGTNLTAYINVQHAIALTNEAAAWQAGDVVASTNLQAVIDAEAVLRAAGDVVSATNLQAVINVSNAADRAYADGLAAGMTNYTDSVAATNVVAHAAIEAGTNTLGHVQHIGFSYADNLLYFTAPMNCTGMVFRFYTAAGTATNIYLWRDNP